MLVKIELATASTTRVLSFHPQMIRVVNELFEG